MIKQPYVIGITGGIASGKSTLSNYLIDHNYLVIDCDKLTTQSYVDCFEEISSVFSDCIENQMVNRTKLAHRVFSNEEDKLKLESIIHPYVRRKMIEAISSTKSLIFLDIPLLYEAKMEDLCDEIWVVYVPKHVQLERLMARNRMDEATAKIRIDSQMPLDLKRQKADVVFDNSQTIETLHQQIQQRLEGFNA